MSYVDEVFDLVVAKNPAQPEFHQAVKEVLESLRVVIEANEEKYRKMLCWGGREPPQRPLSLLPVGLVEGGTGHKPTFSCSFRPPPSLPRRVGSLPSR